MADDYDCGYSFDEEDYDDSIFKEYIMDNLFWRQKNGEKININKMTDFHVKNCIKIPLYPNKENWDIIFKYELNKRLNK